MKKRVFLAFIFLTISANSKGFEYGETQYPDIHTGEYSNILNRADYKVKVGYPANQKPTIWVKGSNKYKYVEIFLDNKKVSSIELNPPFYENLFTDLIDNRIYTLVFTDAHGNTLNEKIKTISESWLKSDRKPFSIAFYGCFQPFTVEDREGELVSTIYERDSNNNFSKKFLKTFSDSLLNKGRVSDIFPNTKLLVGTGDQVYMDAGYEVIGARKDNFHPISGWETGVVKPSLIRPMNQYIEHVEKTYRAFGSVKYLSDVQKSIPQVNAWDDHEIRDGWGSQGDESNIENMRAFEDARKGYIAHQLLNGPLGLDALALLSGKESLDQQFEVGDYKGYVLDLRTNRNITNRKNRVLSETQKNNFKTWMEKLERGQKVIIVSTMPLFLKNNDTLEKAGKLKNDLSDDLNDAWSSKYNVTDQRWLISIMLKKRIEDKIRPIFLSGDYHKGSMSEIWYGDQNMASCTKPGEKNKFIFGYEIIASGLYHEGLAKNYYAWGFDRGEAQRVGDHQISDLKIHDSTYCIDPFVKVSEVTENYGGVVSTDSDGDVLKLVVGNSNFDEVISYVLPLNWKKTFDPDIEKDGSWKTWLWNLVSLTSDTFNVPYPEHSEYPLSNLTDGYGDQ